MREVLVVVAVSVVMGAGCFGQRVEVGEACGARDVCDGESACISLEQESTQGVCLERCDPMSTKVCLDGAVCSELGSGEGVCNLLGGEKRVGQSCEASSDCEVGTICVQDATGVSAGYCWKACDPARPESCPEAQACKTYGVGGASVCQPELLGLCGINGESCTQGYECGVSPDRRSAQEFTAFAARCNVSDCVVDADCPAGSVCRDFHGTYSHDESRFAGPTQEAMGGRYCYAMCEGQDACGPLPLYACLSPVECGALEGEEVCKAFLDDASLCVPTF